MIHILPPFPFYREILKTSDLWENQDLRRSERKSLKSATDFSCFLTITRHYHTHKFKMPTNAKPHLWIVCQRRCTVIDCHRLGMSGRKCKMHGGGSRCSDCKGTSRGGGRSVYHLVHLESRRTMKMSKTKSLSIE
jgi:hypothetical protein